MTGTLRRLAVVMSWTIVAVILFVAPAKATHCSGCIDADDIASSAVGASEIATGAVGASEIATGAVGASEIATGAVTGIDIANGTVSYLDLGSTAKTTADFVSVALVDNMNGPLRTLTSLPLGVGTWWISATFEVDNKTEGQDVYVDCWMRQGSTTGTILDHRNMHLEIGDGGTGNSQSVAFQSVRTLSGAQTIYLTCDPLSTPDNLDAEYVKLTAMKILNPI